MKRGLRIAAGAGGVAVLAGAVAVAAAGLGGADLGPTAASDLPPATTPVTRMTLTQTTNVSGTLGYGEPVDVAARGHGTLTWLPAEGATIKRGHQVYRADDAPVPLWYGTLPLYRTLRAGMSGADVKEVEKNLAALGYTGFTVDDDYTSATATAVSEWQEDLGVTESGTVDPGAVVLAPGAIRVAQVKAALGNPASGQLLSYTPTTRTVTVALDVAKQGLAKKGAKATITLPDNRTLPGTVSRVGSVATQGQQGEPSTIEVVVDVAAQSALGRLDQAPVDVTLTAAQKADVLTLPVAALVALAEGGYGVQVVNGSSVRYVAVTTGMFANGRVEISGSEITAGTTVGVPR